MNDLREKLKTPFTLLPKCEKIPRYTLVCCNSQIENHCLQAYVKICPLISFHSYLTLLLQIGPPSMLLDQELLLNDANGPLVQAYKEYQVDISELLGANFDKAKILMGSVLNFEINLAKVKNESRF